MNIHILNTWGPSPFFLDQQRLLQPLSTQAPFPCVIEFRCSSEYLTPKGFNSNTHNQHIKSFLTSFCSSVVRLFAVAAQVCNVPSSSERPHPLQKHLYDPVTGQKLDTFLYTINTVWFKLTNHESCSKLCHVLLVDRSVLRSSRCL